MMSFLGRLRSALTSSAVASAPTKELSGVSWVARYPTGKTTATLALSFRRGVQGFITSLEHGGAHVSISATRRPRERAYLMHWAWRIDRKEVSPSDVPLMEGVDIEWVHPTYAESRDAAQAMVEGYGLKYRPSLTSKHIPETPDALVTAIDMTITNWQGRTVVNGKGARVRLDSEEDLYQCGATFGVMKLRGDEPHWSDNGR